MSEAYRVKKFHHVTSIKQRRLLKQNLIPLCDRFPEVSLNDVDIDDVMSSPEALSLNINDFDRYESFTETIQNLLKGDWLIDYVNDHQPIKLYKIKGYRFEPHTHLYIKHYAEVEHSFKVKQSVIPERVIEQIIAADHLATMPLDVARMLERYESLVQARNKKIQEEQLQKEQEEKCSSRQNMRPRLRRRAVSKNGPVIVKRANPEAKAIIARFNAKQAELLITPAERKRLRQKALQKLDKSYNEGNRTEK